MQPAQSAQQHNTNNAIPSTEVKLAGGNDAALQGDPQQVLLKEPEFTDDPYFKSAFDNTVAGMVITDLQGRIIKLNRAFSEIAGYWEEELINRPIRSIIHPGDLKKYEDHLNQVLSLESIRLPLENRYQSRNQKEVWIRNNFSVIRDQSGNPKNILLVCVSIQEERSAQYKSEVVAKRFRFLADSSPQQIWTADATGNLNYFSHAFYEYSGLTHEDIRIGSWNKMVFEEDKEFTVKLWKQSIETGEEFVMEHRLIRRDGKYTWHLSRAIAEKDDLGKIIMWVGATTNIHQQKTIEEQLEKQVFERTHDLREANFNLKHSNHDLEQFAYIATHDLQEPLRKIRTYSSLINKNFNKELPEEAQNYMSNIEKASDRMSKLIDDLLNYSILLRPQEIFEVVDLNLIIDQVLNDFESLIKEKHAEVHKINLPRLNAVPMQMHQLFYNLISNALKFTMEDREPLVQVTSRELNEAEIIALHLDMELRYVEIVIRDNGIGFNQLYAEKVFTIFQRLNSRKKYAGTGIGLALCQKIVLYHHGLIYANATENEGASFHVLLPL